MSAATRVVLKDDPFNDPDADAMEFRLTYEGPLLGASSRDTRAPHKHKIRKVFHRQLRQLWRTNPYLKDGHPVQYRHGMTPFLGLWGAETLLNSLIDQCNRDGFRFVPLVREELSLICSVSILYLRPGRPGTIIGTGGDIDNRMKTLFDALRLPKNKSELGGYGPEEGEDPFFCLLEDDKLITHASIETDVLLEPLAETSGENDARVVITVRIRPYDMNPGNMSFG